MLTAGKLVGVWYKGNHAFLSDYTGRKQATELNGVDGFVLPMEALEGEDAVGRSKRVSGVLVLQLGCASILYWPHLMSPSAVEGLRSSVQQTRLKRCAFSHDHHASQAIK